MSQSSWPRDQRPRERLLAHGAGSLSDAELLAIFLRTGTSGTPVMVLAQQLIERFTSLRGLMTASQRQFCEVRGLGSAKYAQIQAAMEMARRVMDEPLRQGDPLRSPEDTRRYLCSRLGTYPHEVFAGLFLDNRHRVIQYRELFRGTIDGAAVYPREVVRQALEDNAAAVIFAHNHPSGVAEPSQADVALTKRLREALGLVDIRVLDHMVVGHGEVVSLAERGLL
ncbi:RadC family protein [Marinobacter xestospongiae]|uniref:DNA repair protein RadC n=1 Tax=Marinobacter xestospongiae TaxID=994319 RepID=A0ABU3VWE0_9GAMM|nr:DNA repair protein RadC [Marinobacter xestospongiae]MCG8517582.1 DNA repair protein RadC [Pseudomonadales bacterium]MDV2078589.1 DNA repair protein RadC [Marinobacter xestospongiae]